MDNRFVEKHLVRSVAASWSIPGLRSGGEAGESLPAHLIDVVVRFGDSAGKVGGSTA